jgi:hypothetical protein
MADTACLENENFKKENEINDDPEKDETLVDGEQTTAAKKKKNKKKKKKGVCRYSTLK